MDTVPSADRGDPKRRGRLSATLRDSLREVSIQLSLLNHQVGSRLGLKGTDLECFALIESHEAITPSDLARLSGLHPATMTGVLDRLERGGWISRDRDVADRRGVILRPLRTRVRDVARLYSGMTTAIDAICADYAEDELVTILGFLARAADAGRGATTELAGRQEAQPQRPAQDGSAG